MISKDCKKHNHKLTNFLKVFIYMLVMLAPFFAIGIKCWYVVNNYNAQDSYSGEYNYQFDAKYNIATLPNGNSYNGKLTFNNDIYNSIYLKMNTMAYSPGPNIEVQDLIIYNENELTYQNNYTSADLANVNFIRYNNYNYLQAQPAWYRNSQYIQQYGSVAFCIDNTPVATIKLYSEKEIELKFTKINSTNINIAQGAYSDVNVGTIITDQTLSSVFYSAVDELDDASIFSWTTNTGIYTAINNMCIKLGIVSPPLAVLLTYWSLITAIYIIIDIVIESFTYLTHWFTDKMV